MEESTIIIDNDGSASTRQNDPVVQCEIDWQYIPIRRENMVWFFFGERSGGIHG